MTIDASFLKEVSSMSAAVETLDFDGIPYTTKKVHMVGNEIASCLDIHTLSGIAEYCIERAEEMNGCVVQIKGPETVHVFSNLDEKYRNRECYVSSELISDPFEFGREIPVEQFIIELQAKFVPCDNVAAILKVVGNISSQAEHKTMDDGVTQTVTARTGIAKVGIATVPNPVELSPYRTFQEVSQPASKFVFRMKQGRDGVSPTCALYEADGGAWKNAAIKNIKEFLEFELPDDTVIIA